MTNVDTRRWKALFGKVCAMHGREWDDAQSRFYFDALKVCDYRDVEAAGEALMQTLAFFPKPAEWRRAVGERVTARRLAQAREIAARRLTPEIHCPRCQDTFMCETSPGRYWHCDCKATNPNYAVARARLAAGDPSEAPGLPLDEAPAPAEAHRLVGEVRAFRKAGEA